MADLAAWDISPVFIGTLTDSRAHLATSAGVSLGQAVMLDPATGRVGPASAAAASTAGFRGVVASKPCGFVGSLVADVVESGYLAGFDLRGLPFDAPVYLSDTPGKLSSTPGTVSVVIGRVALLADRKSRSCPYGPVLFIPPALS